MLAFPVVVVAVVIAAVVECTKIHLEHKAAEAKQQAKYEQNERKRHAYEDELNSQYFKRDILVDLQSKSGLESAEDLTDSETKEFLKMENQIAGCTKKINNLENKIADLK